jgi:hypothetical protein
MILWFLDKVKEPAENEGPGLSAAKQTAASAPVASIIALPNHHTTDSRKRIGRFIFSQMAKA